MFIVKSFFLKKLKCKNFEKSQSPCKKFDLHMHVGECNCDKINLTLKMPIKNCSRPHFNFLLLSFEENKLDVSSESSA